MNNSMIYYYGDWYIGLNKYEFVTWLLIGVLVVVLVGIFYTTWLERQNKRLKDENSKLKSMLSISELRKAELLEKYEGKN